MSNVFEETKEIIDLFEFTDNDYTSRDSGYSSLLNIKDNIGWNTTSIPGSGSTYQILMADTNETYYVRYNSNVYLRTSALDHDNLFAWCYGNEIIYTNEIALIAGASIMNENGVVIGTLQKTPGYMKQYTIKVTAIDCDIPTDQQYSHTVRFEFFDCIDLVDVKLKGYDYASSNSCAILNSLDFLNRIPSNIRNLISPVTIDCYRSVAPYSGLMSEQYNLENQMFFLPSAYEITNTTGPIMVSGFGSIYWRNEGHTNDRSFYYGVNASGSSSDSKLIRRYDKKFDTGMITRTLSCRLSSNQYYNSNAGFVCTTETGSIIPLNLNSDQKIGIAPAFVIAG